MKWMLRGFRMRSPPSPRPLSFCIVTEKKESWVKWLLYVNIIKEFYSVKLKRQSVNRLTFAASISGLTD